MNRNLTNEWDIYEYFQSDRFWRRNRYVQLSISFVTSMPSRYNRISRLVNLLFSPLWYFTYCFSRPNTNNACRSSVLSAKSSLSTPRIASAMRFLLPFPPLNGSEESYRNSVSSFSQKRVEVVVRIRILVRSYTSHTVCDWFHLERYHGRLTAHPEWSSQRGNVVGISDSFHSTKVLLNIV